MGLIGISNDIISYQSRNRSKFNEESDAPMSARIREMDSRLHTVKRNQERQVKFRTRRTNLLKLMLAVALAILFLDRQTQEENDEKDKEASSLVT